MNLKKANFRKFFKIIGDRVDEFNQRMKNLKSQKEKKYAEALVPRVKQSSNTIVELAPLSVVKSAALVLFMFFLVYFTFQIASILLIFFVSFLLAAAMDPLVDRLQKIGLPRALSVILIYLVSFAIAGLFITNVVALIAQQVVAIAGNVGTFVNNLAHGQSPQYPFAEQLNPYLQQFFQTVDIRTAVSQFQNALQILSTQLLSISFGLFNVLLVLILTFFMTVEEKAMEDFFLSLFPSKYAVYISTRMELVRDQIGNWLRGQLLVSLIAGVLTYIGFVLMGINYALTLSIIAGIGLLVPVVGGVFAWVITFPIVFNQSPVLSLWMSLYYFILNQFEANIIVPYVMNKVVGLSPIIIIFAMLVGGQFLGILGLVLSIPIATTVTIFVRDYTAKIK